MNKFFFLIFESIKRTQNMNFKIIFKLSSCYSAIVHLCIESVLSSKLEEWMLYGVRLNEQKQKCYFIYNETIFGHVLTVSFII